MLFRDMEKLKIVKIEKMPIRDRYDLTVNSTHNFFANGILIHNTSFIAANIKVRVPKTFKTGWNWLNAVLNKAYAKYVPLKWQSYTEEYGNVYSSRTVIKNQFINQDALKYNPENFDIRDNCQTHLLKYVHQDLSESYNHTQLAYTQI